MRILPAPTEATQPATRLPQAGRREARLFRTALEHLDAGRHGEAVAYLQTILDAETDGFYEIDEASHRLVSLRAEAVRRLETLEGAGRQAYELRYGPTAQSLLDEAVAAHDPERVAAIARRFPATASGRDAAYRSAVARLDAGELLAASVTLERLRAADHPHRAAVLLRLAVAYARMGSTARFEATLKDLEKMNADLTLGDRKLTSPDFDGLRALMAADNADAEADIPDWPVPGGDAGRTNHRASSRGATADWSTAALIDPFRPPGGPQTPADERLTKWAAQTVPSDPQGGRRAVPASRPAAAGGRIFFRTPAGLTAADAATGEHAWRTLADGLCWDYLPDPVASTPSGETAARTFVGQRIWSDATWGAVATDGRFVFAVEETGAAVPLPPAVIGGPHGVAPVPSLPAAFNRLAAYDAATGSRVWEAGGPPKENGLLAGAFFLGPPVPAGGLWYALAESSGVTRLVALAPPRPEGVLWTQPVAEHDAPIDANGPRRTAGLSPSVAGGLLVCPVGPGTVVAVDPSTRSLAWAYVTPPRHGEAPSDAARLPPAVDGPFAPGPTEPPLPELIATDRTLLIRSAETLTAVDPLDGRVVWETPLPAALWLIGATSDRAFVQCRNEVVAVRLSDGKSAWDAAATTGPPSGRGLSIGDRLYLPVADGTLAVLDAGTGRTVASVRSPRDEPFGNLIAVAGTLVSQSATRVVAVPIPE